MSKATYKILVEGAVPRYLVGDFEGATVQVESRVSTIHLSRADDARLHGLLAALSRGGFTLIELRRESGITAVDTSTDEM